MLSVAAHLGIDLSEYDGRIRTFIPHYGALLGAVASAVPRKAVSIVDLGVGTGALARRLLAGRPDATLIGVDADPDILSAARRRLSRYRDRATLVRANFLRTPIPRADAVVASLALHHVRTMKTKRRLYRTIRRAIRAGGVIATGDVFLADDARLRHAHMDAWRRHLLRSYTRRQAAKFLSAWAAEDRYFPIGREIEALETAGFAVEVLWRRPPFGALVGRKR